MAGRCTPAPAADQSRKGKTKMKVHEIVLLVSMALITVMLTARWAGAEDDCAEHTSWVVGLGNGVLCIGEPLI
jgi:hypothetical protein